MKTLATGFCMHRNAHKYESCIQTFTEYVGRLRGWCQSESEHGEAIFVTVHYWQMQKSPSHVIDTYYAYSQFKDRRTNSCTHPVYLVKFHTDGISEFPSSSVKKQKNKTEKKKKSTIWFPFGPLPQPQLHIAPLPPAFSLRCPRVARDINSSSRPQGHLHSSSISPLKTTALIASNGLSPLC